jgi:uncharacterized protein YndB with AHSA1/START domain
MSQATTLNAVISTERDIYAPPRKVFAAFEQPDQLAPWWGPKDFTNTFEQFEFKPGGGSTYHYRDMIRVPAI